MKPSSSPVRVFYRQGCLILDFYLLMNRKARSARSEVLSDFDAVSSSMAEAICEGIRQGWSFDIRPDAALIAAMERFLRLRQPEELGEFLARYSSNSVEGAEREAEPLRVRSRLYCLDENPAFLSLRFLRAFLLGERRPLKVYVRPYRLLPAHVASSLPRRIWGIFRTGQLVSMGLNWSPAWPGYIVIPEREKGRRLRRISAHEAGHVLGLGDAYAAWYRAYDSYDGSESYMMHSNGRVHPEEILMLVEAQTAGRMRFFPMRFSWPRFRKGFKEEIKQYQRRVDALEEERKSRRETRR